MSEEDILLKIASSSISQFENILKEIQSLYEKIPSPLYFLKKLESYKNNGLSPENLVKIAIKVLKKENISEEEMEFLSTGSSEKGYRLSYR